MLSRLPWVPLIAGIAAGMVASAIAAVASGEVEEPAAQPGSRRVALIGDSYAEGLGPELRKLIPGLFVESRRGSSVAQWRSTWSQTLPSFAPTLVIVSLGVNGGGSQNPADFQAIASAIRGLGSGVLWIEPPLGVTAVDPSSARAIIRSLGVQTMPAFSTPMAADGLHPASYGPWARAIAQEVARLS